jgi:peptidyl-prolyl cis-trans isomerase D
VKGDLGFAVIRVSKITPGQAVTLEQIRPQLEAELRKDAAAEKVYEMSQAYDDAHGGGANLARIRRRRPMCRSSPSARSRPRARARRVSRCPA